MASVESAAAQGPCARPAVRGERLWVLAAPALLACLALALFFVRVETPGDYVFDELYYAFTAAKYVAGDADVYSTDIEPGDDPAVEWTHPPLAKLLIAGGILAFGDEPLGWRIAGVLFGVAGIVIAFHLALALTGDRAVAVLAALLLMLDGLYFVESRTGMPNLFLLVFANGALLAFARVLTVPPERSRGPLLATGTCLGLAIATKWSAVALAGLIGLTLCWRAWRLWRATPGAESNRGEPVSAGVRAYAVWGALALGAVPIAIYLASYLHFFLTGHGWVEFVALHREMFAYHRELGTVHDYSSRWWEWPMAARPIWYFEDVRRRFGTYVFANGNPLLYWPMVAAVLWVAVDWWGRRPAALTVLLIGFFGQWLPWALSPRGTFAYHFLPVVPLGCLALAIAVVGGWRRGGAWRLAAVGYGVAVVAVFAFFYPLYTAVPLTPDQYELRIWLESWR